MSQTIDNDSYLIIVGGDSSAINIKDYSEEKKTYTKDFLNQATQVNGIGKAVVAGYTSPIAQNLVSKFLPDSTLGRINSSLFDIIKDGKVSSDEVLEDFISSCNGELDTVAIGLGLPSVSTLYSALAPNGSGVIATDFLDSFSKVSNDTVEEETLVQNTNSGNATIIKLKLVISDSESYSSSLPKRRTEKGFNFVDYVNNEFPNFEFQAILGGIGHDLYTVKEALISLRKDKAPFNVFVNDKYNNKQYMVENCLFSSLNFGTGVESANSKTCSISFEPIPEGELRSTKLENISNSISSSNSSGISRNQKKNNSSIDKKAKTTPKAQGSTKKVGVPKDKAIVTESKNALNSAKAAYTRKENPISKETYNQRCDSIENKLKRTKPGGFNDIGESRKIG